MYDYTVNVSHTPYAQCMLCTVIALQLHRASCPVLAGCDNVGLFDRYDIFPKSDCDQFLAASQVWHRQTSFPSLTRANLGQGCWQQGQWLLASPLVGVLSLFSKSPLILVGQVGHWL